MKLTPQQVSDIARLARLEIAAADVPGYCASLSSILDFVAQLESVSAEIVPVTHPEVAGQRLRTDAPGAPVERERYQENAAAVDAGLYLVPRVLE